MTILERITKATHSLGFACDDIQSACPLASPLECIVVADLHERAVALHDDLIQLHNAMEEMDKPTKAMKTETVTMEHAEPELDAAFKRVQNQDDWRAPIDTTIQVKDANKAYQELVIEAIMFYTATKATITHVQGDLYQVTAVGYRNGPAGP